ncbi:MAG: response regulator [Phenylobacterium sp.]|uniref:response regulator n=1 Tax=Phenylobacterium sp. TaxID=1871053 RepID=UPI0012197CDC|nr:response regulator [Phenylobacterium sp.]TAJ71872.1 MAG: response regulator [Phenylobacterium sp.]
MIAALSGLRLLLVEDETLVAMMVEDMLAEFGCVVADVAGSVSRGLALAADDALALDGAILDVNLGGEKVFPVAQVLADRGIPFIFATGYGVAGVAEAFSHVPVLAKPYEAGALERMLTAALSAAGRGGSPPA